MLLHARPGRAHAGGPRDAGLNCSPRCSHGVDLRQGGTSTVGVIFGTFGAGCAACGAAVLVGLLSLFGVSTALLWLPLDGLEFALLGVVVLLLSIHWLAAGMRGGQIRGCPVDLG